MARARRVASRRAKPGRAKQGPEEANREPVAQTEFEKMQSRLEMAFRRLPIRVALFEGHIPSVVRALILMRPYGKSHTLLLSSPRPGHWKP